MTTNADNHKANFIAWSAMAKPERISFAGTSMPAVRMAMEEVFGTFPIRLSRKKDINILAGMCAASGEGRAPYEMLHVALDKYGELELNLEA